MTRWKSLLYISVCEVDNRVSIWPLLSSNTVVEYNFFSAILIKLVNFTILASDFLHHYILIFFLWMIRRLELKFILIFCFSYPRLIVFLRVNTHHHLILLFRNVIIKLSCEFFDCRWVKMLIGTFNFAGWRSWSMKLSSSLSDWRHKSLHWRGRFHIRQQLITIFNHFRGVIIIGFLCDSQLLSWCFISLNVFSCC